MYVGVIFSLLRVDDVSLDVHFSVIKLIIKILNKYKSIFEKSFIIKKKLYIFQKCIKPQFYINI